MLSEIDSAMDAMFLGQSVQGRLQGSYFERAAPFRIQFECTTECTAECTYCYAKATRPGEPLTTREIKGLLRRAANLGVKQIDWMGGDPLERPDWIELLQAARYCNMTNNLWTCGPRLNDVVTAKRVLELTEGGYVMVHLDSLDPDILRSLRRAYTPSTTRDTLKGMELLKDMGKPAYEIGNLLMLTSAQSRTDVRKTMTTLYDKMGVRTCLMSLKPVDEGRALTRLLPNPAEVDAAYRIRDSLFMTPHTVGCQDFPKEYCGSTFFISIDGQVSSCYALRRKLGSVREHTLDDIIASNASSLFFSEFRTVEKEVTCPTCERKLCWGCRANAFYFGNGAYSLDPVCSNNTTRTKIDLPY